MRLVTFGDSFAAGCELADHLMYLNYPYGEGGTENGDLDWLMNAPKVPTKVQFDHRQEEMSRAFTAKLGQLLKAQTENHGISGASQDAIFKSVVNRLSGLAPKDVFVLVMITNPFRFVAPFKNEWTSVQMYAEKKDEFTDLKKFYLEHGTEALMIEHHLMMLQATMSIIKQSGFKSLLIDSMNVESMRVLIQNHLKNKALVNGLELDMIPSMANTVFKHGIKKPKRAGGHYTEEVHEAFAHDLLQEIGKQ